MIEEPEILAVESVGCGTADHVFDHHRHPILRLDDFREEPIHQVAFARPVSQVAGATAERQKSG